MLAKFQLRAAFHHIKYIVINEAHTNAHSHSDTNLRD